METQQSGDINPGLTSGYVRCCPSAPRWKGDRRHWLTKKGETTMPTTTAPIYDWTQAVMTSAVAALAMFLGAIPKALGFVVILLIGWLIASALAGIVANLLRAVHFNDMAQRSCFSGFIRN